MYVKELRRIGVEVPIFGIELDHSVVGAAGQSADGIVAIGPAAPESDFSKNYRERFGAMPDIPSHQSYDAVKLLAEAIRAKGLGTQNALEFFRNFKEYNGASGAISSKSGVISTSMAFYTVRNGKLIRNP